MSEQLESEKTFPARTPCNSTESELIELQQESDAVGFRLYDQILRGNFESEEVEIIKRLGNVASERLAEIVPFNTDSTFSIRYLYDEKGDRNKLRLVYPSDSWHYSAYVEGKINAVKTLLAEHPSMERSGDVGFRLCAEVEASRVAGWRGHSRLPKLSIYAPIGEIITGEVSYEQGMAERLQPSEELYAPRRLPRV